MLRLLMVIEGLVFVVAGSLRSPMCTYSAVPHCTASSNTEVVTHSAARLGVDADWLGSMTWWAQIIAAVAFAVTFTVWALHRRRESPILSGDALVTGSDDAVSTEHAGKVVVVLSQDKGK